MLTVDWYRSTNDPSLLDPHTGRNLFVNFVRFIAARLTPNFKTNLTELFGKFSWSDLYWYGLFLVYSPTLQLNRWRVPLGSILMESICLVTAGYFICEAIIDDIAGRCGWMTIFASLSYQPRAYHTFCCVKMKVVRILLNYMPQERIVTWLFTLIDVNIQIFIRKVNNGYQLS